MLTILMGRAKSGKTEWMLRRIAALGDSSRQVLLVPEHISHEAEVDLCRVLGPTASRDAEVLSFRSLSSRVLAETGGLAEFTLDNGGKLLTMRRVLQELALLTDTPYITPATVQKVLQREERMYPARPDGQLADVLRGKTLEEIDRLAVQLALSECGGSQKATAARLGISRTTLWRMLQKQPGEEC